MAIYQGDGRGTGVRVKRENETPDRVWAVEHLRWPLRRGPVQEIPLRRPAVAAMVGAVRPLLDAGGRWCDVRVDAGGRWWVEYAGGCCSTRALAGRRPYGTVVLYGPQHSAAPHRRMHLYRLARTGESSQEARRPR